MIFFSKVFWQMVRMKNSYVFVVAACFIVISSLLACVVEPSTFSNPFDGFWWVMATVTTVGYGDLYPHSAAGRCFGIILFIFGISLISIAISKVVDAMFLYRRKKEEGKLRYTGQNHFVIIDWSRQAEHAIREIMCTDPQADIVLIAMLEKTPFVHERVHYVQGNPVREQTLQMANLGQAKAVFIFADDTADVRQGFMDPSFVDGKTLLIATTIERCYQHVYTVVEIRERENLPSFRHVKIDDFVFGSETISQLAVRSAFNPGVSSIFAQLLSRDNGDDLFEVHKKNRWTTFRDAFEDLLSQGATLISDGTRMDINRRLSETIPENARLFVICTAETYEKLKGC